jgi:glycosyltransferase involved in cell wall biosynthesis
MRVLMVTSAAGDGEHVEALARGLVARGHQVQVLTRAGGDAARLEHEDVGGVELVRVPEPPPVIPPTDVVPRALGVASRLQAVAGRSLREGRADVVHTFGWEVAHAGAALRDGWSLPLVASLRPVARPAAGWPEPAGLIDEIERWLGREAHRVVVPSERARDRLTARCDRRPETIEVVRDGVAVLDPPADPSELARVRAAATGPRTRMIVVDGCPVDAPALATVVRALADVRARVGPSRLFLPGAGHDAPRTRRTIRTLGLQRHVRFVGDLDDRARRLRQAVADVVVVPGPQEPFRPVAAEVLAAGTPVVVGDTEGTSELLRDGARGPFPTGGVRQLTDELVAALADAPTPRPWAVGVSGPREAGVGWEAVAARIETVYERAVADARAARERPSAAGSRLRSLTQRRHHPGGEREVGELVQRDG